MKKALKFGKANGYIINIQIKVCKLWPYVTLIFAYKCAGHVNVLKIFLT